MTPQDIMNLIKLSNGHGIATLSPGPVKIRVADCDKRGFEMLDWLKATYPNATIQETIDTIMSAYWWVIFWSCMTDAEEER